MFEAILQFGRALLNFLGVLAEGPAGKKVEEVLPEKSASERALEQLKKTDDVSGPATYQKQ